MHPCAIPNISTFMFKSLFKFCFIFYLAIVKSYCIFLVRFVHLDIVYVFSVLFDIVIELLVHFCIKSD